MISIVIPIWNQLECTRQCVSSILQNTTGDYRLILVDNGSTEPVHDFCRAVPGAVAVRSETNRGFAGGVNLGLAHVEGHALLLNNDTLVPRGWLDGLRAALESAPDIGMVGPMSNYVSGSQLIPGLAFTTLDEINDFAARRRAACAGRLRDVARLVGFCMLIRARALAEVGPFDERYGIGNYEDDDYCVRVIRAGYRLVVDEAAFVFHYGHRTFSALGIAGAEWERLLSDNAARFDSKWRLKPEDRVDACREAMLINREAGARFASGDVTGALRLYRDAIRVAPTWARNHNDLAVVLWEVGAREEAFERARAAVALDPDYPEARANLAEMAAALGRPDEGREEKRDEY